MHPLPREVTLTVAKPLRQPRFSTSYEQILPEMLKLMPDDYLAINLDIPSAVTRVLGAASKLRSLREACAQKLNDFDLSIFDRIETLALAMGHAHALCGKTSASAQSLKQLSARVIELRAALITDLMPFARRGLIDVQRIAALPGPNGYHNQAFDLLTLVTMARIAWPNIQAKTAITRAELDEAELLAEQLLTGAGSRKKLPEQVAHCADMRSAAYTLFMRAYSQLRRAAEYLRWDEGDAAEHVPPLTAGRKRRKREVIETEPSRGEETEPETSALALSEAELARHTENAAAGMPGSDPFVDAGTRVRYGSS